MPDQMFGHGGFVASRDPVATDPPHFQMGGRDRQHVAFPFPGGEALPRVGGIVGGMRAAIHVDRPFGRLPGDVRVIGNQLLRRRVDFLPDPQVRRTTRRVVGRVRLALMLGQRQQRCVPTVATQPGGVVDREAEVIADLRSWDALGLVLVKAGRPFSREVRPGGARHFARTQERSRTRSRAPAAIRGAGI